MEIGILLLPVMPVRKESSDLSEMLTQVLFGESFHILQEKESWAFISLSRDSYQGWVDKKMIHRLPPEQSSALQNEKPHILSSLITRVYSITNQSELILPAGSEIMGYNSGDNSFTLAEEKFVFKTTPEIISEVSREFIVQTAYKFLNAPYLWGGKTIFGIDCSGFTQVVMKINGMDIPRDTKFQVEKGVTLSFIEEAKPGDLAFFDNKEGQIIHTGIIAENNTIIHASGQVRKDRFDQQGIFNKTLNRYTHKLRVIKSIM